MEWPVGQQRSQNFWVSCGTVLRVSKRPSSTDLDWNIPNRNMSFLPVSNLVTWHVSTHTLRLDVKYECCFLVFLPRNHQYNFMLASCPVLWQTLNMWKWQGTLFGGAGTAGHGSPNGKTFFANLDKPGWTHPRRASFLYRSQITIIWGWSKPRVWHVSWGNMCVPSMVRIRLNMDEYGGITFPGSYWSWYCSMAVRKHVDVFRTSSVKCVHCIYSDTLMHMFVPVTFQIPYNKLFGESTLGGIYEPPHGVFESSRISVSF